MPDIQVYADTNTSVIRFVVARPSADDILVASSLGIKNTGFGGTFDVDCNKILRYGLYMFMLQLNNGFSDHNTYKDLFASIKEIFDRIDAPRIEYMKSKLSREVTLLVRGEKVTKTTYEWMFEDQKEVVKASIFLKDILISFETGMGKSLIGSSISTLHDHKKTLIVCTKTAKMNWRRELIKWGESPEDITVVNGSGKKTLKTGEKFIIITYDLARTKLRALLSRDIDHVIIDESHKIKNIKSKRFRVVEEIKKMKTPRMSALSGTPITNRSNDLYAPAKLSNHLLGRSYKDYKQRFCIVKASKFGEMVIGSKNEELLHKCFANFMIRNKVKKTDALGVDVSYKRMYLGMEYYSADYNNLVNEMLNKKGMSKIELHSYITSLSRLCALSKTPAMIDYVEDIAYEYNEKIIVFSTFTDVIKKFEEHFKDKCVVIQGSTSDAMRDHNKMKFIEDDTCKIFVLQTQAGSESLDGLQTVCNKMVYIDIPLVPKDLTQGVGRLLRLLQTKGVECGLAIAEGTIDERLVDMNISKEKSINLILDNANKTFEFQDVEFELLNFLKSNNGKVVEDSAEVEESIVTGGELD